MDVARAPQKTGLPREVVKWLQSLDLSFYPKNMRRDFSNGYLVAEILSRYYTQDYLGQWYDRGVSLSAKQWNWSQIERSLQKQNLHLTKEMINGSIHCKPGAAELLVQEVYTLLTNRSLRDVQGPAADFTDRGYQELLPTLARSTASRAIKNNLRTTEIMAEPDISTNQRRAEVILHRHLEHKAEDRVLNPVSVTGRLKVKPNLCRPAAKEECFASSRDTTSKFSSSSTRSGGAAVSFQEIKVHQPVKWNY
ncbi:spermatogenesis-associated protein 4 [Pseudoliparis swirei]|uniref:spermatogenesis-associated protein 4 n=1 Tax=Pseudoliparis swirei TaxID=2059687 RepID=UPI0024BE4A6C|nr:spermatogenesis-associated protein 4 [Pseudoliparis swirei]